jgi:hypothetical protein
VGVEVAATEAPDGKEAPVEKARVDDKPARAKMAKTDEKPYWQKQAEEGSADSSRTAVVLFITVIVVIVVLSAVLIGYLMRPQPRTVYSELSVASQDVSILTSTPSGDNKTAIVPVEVELRNIGEGKSGVINVWVGAFNRTNENQRFGDFNTSDLKRVDNGQIVNLIEPKDKPGSIVRARGNLSLPPGDYQVRLKIYEDGGKRTLVYGYIFVKVDQSMVATPQPYVPEGGGRGRSYEVAPAGTSALPGFEGPLALAAVAAVLLLVRPRRKRC